MKNIIKYSAICIAAASILLGGCAKSDEQSVTSPFGGKVAVSFSARSGHTGSGSRAAIDEGYENGTFSGTWEATDRISVISSLEGTSEHLDFSYDPESRLFKGEMTEGVGRRTYRAIYPATDDMTAIPFGRERAYDGKPFNSAYDAMMSPLLTFDNAPAGKTDDGEGIVFGMQHLTAIIAAGFATSDAAAAEKIKAVVLSADKAISASSLLLDTESMSASLGTDGQSEHIAAIFDGATAPTASDARVFFNVPAGDYGELTLDIVTENHIATVRIDRTGKPLEAGKLYFRNNTIADWSEISDPTAVWTGNEDFAPMEIENDMTGRCSLDINIPAGIRGMSIAIDSPILTQELLGEFGLAAEMDLIDNATYAQMLGGMGLTTGDALVNSRSVLFDVGALVPLINMISGGMAATNKFTVTLTDFSGRTLERTMTFTCNTAQTPTATIAYNGDADLWFNTATLTAKVENEGDSAIAVEYKLSTATEWQAAEHVSGDTYRIAPQFTDVAATDGRLAYKSHVAGTGVWLGNTYDIRITVDGEEKASATFDAGGTKDPIRDASMDNWSTHKVTGVLVAGNVQYPNTDDGNLFWSNGNNKLTPALCSQDNTVAGFNGTSCAKLKGGTAVGVFAAGNLFTGEMAVEGIGGALAKFGQKFAYTGRPSAIKCRYRATIAKMTHVGSKDTENGHVKGETTDPARIMFCIIDWNSRHVIKSGTSVDPSTFFNPETDSSVAEGSVIGYGSLTITESTAAGANGADENGWVELTLPVCWYDTAAKPNADNYSIIISAASSAYGDYLTGSTNNELYIEDFEWVY